MTLGRVRVAAHLRGGAEADRRRPVVLAQRTVRQQSANEAPLPLRTSLSSKRRAGGETLAEAGDAGASLALVVLEPDFCVLDRAGARAALSDTDEMDELGERSHDLCGRLLLGEAGTPPIDRALPRSHASSHDSTRSAPPVAAGVG